MANPTPESAAQYSGGIVARLSPDPAADGKSAEPKKEQPAKYSDGVNAQLSPTAAAGVDLAKIVLSYIAAAMVLTLVILATIEIVNATHQFGMQDKVALQAAAVSILPDQTKLEAWRTGLKTLGTVPAEQQDGWRDLFETIRLSGAVSESQAAILSRCVPPDASKAQPPDISGCDDLIHMLEAASRNAPGNVERTKALVDFYKEVETENQGTRTFWLQISQMILLNLLLPILTALLGYIFGTNQTPPAN